MAVTRIHRSMNLDNASVASLEHRLAEGERMIARAKERGEDTTKLVDFWIELLHRYEDAVDSLPEAA